MELTIIVAVIGVASAIIVASLTAFYSISATRKKTKAETDELLARTQNETLTTLRQSQEILKEMMEPLELEVKNLKFEIEKMKPFICRAQNCPNRK